MDKKKRDTLAILGAIVAGYTAIRVVPGMLPQKLTLTPMDSPEGFRQYIAGETSSAYNAFVGLDPDSDAERKAADARADARVQANICGALYQSLELKPGQVPIASFSDYYCPFCRVQTKRLAELANDRPDDIAIAWHELPIFGERSERAARAALAAKRQGAYVAFHKRLMKSAFTPTPQYLAQLSADLGIDKARLITDMNSDETTQEIEDTAALARTFGFVGTPALVIGRTVVQGQVSDAMIHKIADLERADPSCF